MAEILATDEDVNAYCDGTVIQADEINTELIQISVSRVIKGYLSRAFDSSVLAAWDTPDHTPDIIREIASMLIASQLYFDKVATTTLDIDARHWAQLLYDRAMLMLQGIVSGEITVPDTPVEDVGGMTDLDYFPVDDTDRAFTLGMQLY